jgi:hypothetical protein
MVAARAPAMFPEFPNLHHMHNAKTSTHGFCHPEAVKRREQFQRMLDYCPVDGIEAIVCDPVVINQCRAEVNAKNSVVNGVGGV